jgi:hypothetical protein
MSKLIRNTSDEKSAAFWRAVEEIAAEMQNAPAWMKAGIVLDPRHYETFSSDEDLSMRQKPPRK